MNLKKYLDEIAKYRALFRKEEVNLARRAERGDLDARNALINSCLKLVVYSAKRYTPEGLTTEDLIGAGNEGLIKAYETYNWKKGRFSNWAYNYIKKAVFNLVNERYKGIPLYRKIEKASINFLEKEQRKPSLEELAKFAKIDIGYLKIFSEISKPYLSCEQITEFLEGDNVRYNGEGEEITESYVPEDLKEYKNEIYRDFIYSDTSAKIFQKKTEKERLHEALSKLDIRYKEVIMRNFGMGEYECQSLEDIRKVLGVTRERVRQIRDNSLKKLKLMISKRVNI